MAGSNDFRLPDVGEGLTEAEVVSWLVAVGDHVELNDAIVEVETAKSLVELPSPFAGTVSVIHVEAGATVAVGTVLITVQDDHAPPVSAGPDTPEASTADGSDPGSSTGSDMSRKGVDAPGGQQLEADEKPQVLVGPGPKDAAARRLTIGSRRNDALAGRGGANNPVRTTPPVRALAKTLGVDLESLAAEVEGVITRVDVESAAGTAEQPEKSLSAPASRPASSNSTPALGPRETRIPIKGVRKVTAEAVTRSAFTAPHVTEWLAVDVTATMDAVARLKKDSAWADVRINPLLFVARAFLLAIRSFPDINATWDDDAQEIVIKNYVNLGIAAATPRGLIVPNIKDADQLDLRGLAQALDSLVATARAGKSTPTDMSGGTITITNIGALGVDAGTPILNPGESAILAFGAVRLMPWVHADQLCVRQVTQLAMSFDHRLVDGQLGSNVLARVGSLLNDPGATFLHA
jgi:2-oxoisovalerate dehydrogenase E2 component (dihydrolipoyl transacylase)